MRAVIFLSATLATLEAHAGTPIDPVQRVPVELQGQSQAQIFKTATQCLMQHLKNKEARAPQTVLGFAVPESKRTSTDTSVILTTTDSSIEARHRFRTSGILTEGDIQADVTVDIKDGKYRMRWHDFRYGVAGQAADNAELIKEAAPYKKAMAALDQVSADIDTCMARPQPDQNW